MSFGNLWKDELRLVAEEISLDVKEDLKLIDLKKLIEKSDVFKKEPDFVQGVIDKIIEDKKLKKEKENVIKENEVRSLQMEWVKLAQLERQLELQNGLNSAGREFKDERYDVKLLGRIDPRELENNFNLAKRRFDELKKGFNKNEWIASANRETIRDQETNGIIEECDRDRNEYFMPHRAVVRVDRETTKTRVVFNCGSKSGQSLSLNDV
ncbi:hypothetical protein HNY73_004612 [Argiope bruennichi]|uniref:Uncharacterized protein n=1 Tax=Argiope bruennichi TaxID=94029 RepID=A0A8T0FS16_ARGBR|nr:hypothetical protein HNY73_004612 [Argiope bruennichi]